MGQKQLTSLQHCLLSPNIKNGMVHRKTHAVVVRVQTNGASNGLFRRYLAGHEQDKVIIRRKAGQVKVRQR